MKRCVDTACSDWCEEAALMSLRLFRVRWRCSESRADRNGIRQPWHPATLGAWKGCCRFQCSSERVSPFLWRNGWVSRELLVTTFRFITIESTD